MDAVKSRIGSAFGHDFSGVRVHQHSPRASAAGTPALTIGNDVHFAGSFDDAVIGHELAHVVQQRQGRVHADRPGLNASPALEAEAQVAGLRAARGEAVAFGTRHACSHAAPVAQHYTEYTSHPLWNRLSDDGKMAVQHRGLFGWAESGKIASAEALLASMKSKAMMQEVPGSEVKAQPPNNPKAPQTTLKKFEMVDRAAKTKLQLPDDCGTAAQQVMGSQSYGSESFRARNLRLTTEEFTGASAYRWDDKRPGGNRSTTEDLSGEIYVRIMQRELGKTLTREEALAEWAFFDAQDEKVKRGRSKKSLSKKYGINEFAAPKPGQGVTMGNEFDSPFKEEGKTNFHFAFNMMESGADYITLEDWARSGKAYMLDMYGPPTKDQSFGQYWDTGVMGIANTTMVVQHTESLNGKVNADVKIVDDPAKGNVPSNHPRQLTKGDQVTILRKGKTWMKVEVKSGAQAAQQGWMQNTFFEPK